MKTLLTLNAILLFFIAAHAQSDSTKTFWIKGQVGVNATGFIKQFVVMNNQALGQTSPFDFNAKAFLGWNRFPSFLIGPRMGFGYRAIHTYSNNEQQNNERSDDNTTRSVRVGLELQQIISKRWVVYYGFDYINAKTEISTVSVSQIFNPVPPFEPVNVRTEIISNSKTTGFGPVLGIQFNVNRHLCLGTETTFYYQQTRGGDKTVSDNPNNNTPETFFDTRTNNIQLPFFINCNIVF
jgi:hypothetical protein